MNATNFCFRKTNGSKVILIKNNNFIGIFIPSVGFFSRLALRNLFLLICRSNLISFIFILLSYREISFLIAIVILLSVTSLVALLIIFVCEFGQKRLCINHQEISLIYELFGIKRNLPLPSLRQHIIRLERNKDTFNRRYLTIWAGKQKYEIFTGESYLFSVTNPELDWLTEQLSDWLGLPITNQS